MSEHAGLKFCSYEILITPNTANGQINFPINMYLTGKRTYWMQLYSASTVKYSPITPPTLVADYDLLVTGSVTIHCTDPVLDPSAQGQLKGDWFKQMPLLAMTSLPMPK